MSNRIILRQAGGSTNRRQPLLLQRRPSKMATRVGEVVGGTAAECVAVCCCFPCGVANFLLLAIYKVPAGLYRRVLKKRRHQKMLKEGLRKPTRRHCSCGCCDDVSGSRIYPMCANDAVDIKRLRSTTTELDNNDDATRALEKEMWDQFYGTGFWRSSSNREVREEEVKPSQTLPSSNINVLVPNPQPQLFASSSSWTLYTQFVCAILIFHYWECNFEFLGLVLMFITLNLFVFGFDDFFSPLFCWFLLRFPIGLLCVKFYLEEV